MKKLRNLMLAIAALAMLGMYACNTGGKESSTEEAKEVTEETVEKDEPCEDHDKATADTVVVADSTVVDSAIAEEVPAE